MKYKVKDGYTVRQIAGTWVAVPAGATAAAAGKLVTLNETAVFLWNLLASGAELQELLEKVMEEYEIDRQSAEREIDKYLDLLRENSLLEE